MKGSPDQAFKDTLEISAQAEASLLEQLAPEEQKQVEQFKAIDREVRAHEQAHLAAAGPYATGGASYEYRIGPDGKQYAVGGEVPIDTSPIPDDPEATIQKARVIRSAANAPADPSGQDRAVAAQATRMEAEASQELIQQQQEQREAQQANSTESQLNAPAFASGSSSGARLETSAAASLLTLPQAGKGAKAQSPVGSLFDASA